MSTREQRQYVKEYNEKLRKEQYPNWKKEEKPKKLAKRIPRKQPTIKPKNVKLEQRKKALIEEKRISSTRLPGACASLKKHHKDLKDDPERLSTEFLNELIGRKCE